MRGRVDRVLAFWFGRPGDAGWGDMRDAWWDKEPGFDQACRDACLTLHAAAASGALDHWAEDAEGALALVILLDQLPRNMFRGTLRMYASDAKARAVARLIDGRGFKEAYTPVQQLFADLPYEHAESVADQERHVAFTRDRYRGPQREECLDAALRHHEIVARFGRFPHRNEILGRASTVEEIAFLEEPRSSF